MYTQLPVAPTFKITRVSAPTAVSPVIIGRHQSEFTVAGLNDPIGGMGTYWTVIVPGYGNITIMDIAQQVTGAPASRIAVINDANFWYYSPDQNSMTLTIGQDNRTVEVQGGPVVTTVSLDWSRPAVVAVLTGGPDDANFGPDESTTYSFDVLNLHPYLEVTGCVLSISYDKDMYTKNYVSIDADAARVAIAGKIAPGGTAQGHFTITAAKNATPNPYKLSLSPVSVTLGIPTDGVPLGVAQPQQFTIRPN